MSVEERPPDVQLYLAAERTLLSWIRTGLAMMGFGFVVARFSLFLREVSTEELGTAPPVYPVSLWLGTALVVVGVIVFLAAAYDHLRVTRRITRGETLAIPKRSLGIMVALALAAIGIAMSAYLVLVEFQALHR